MKKIFILSFIATSIYANIEILGFNSDNTIDSVEVKNASDVIQGDLKISDSTVKSSTFNLSGKLENAIVDNSTVNQSSVYVTSSTVENVTINSKSSIVSSGTVDISNSNISQATVYVPSGSILKDSVVKLTSSIDSTKIKDSTVSLCNLVLNSGVSVSGLNIDATCELKNSNINGANISQGNIVYN